MGSIKTTWRSLISFEVKIDDRWYVQVSGWGLHALISLHEKEVPDFIMDRAEVGVRCYAYVNLSEEDPMNLVFEKWELGPECECGGMVFSCRPPVYDQLVCDKCNDPLPKVTRQNHS